MFESRVSQDIEIGAGWKMKPLDNLQGRHYSIVTFSLCSLTELYRAEESFYLSCSTLVSRPTRDSKRIFYFAWRSISRRYSYRYLSIWQCS